MIEQIKMFQKWSQAVVSGLVAISIGTVFFYLEKHPGETPFVWIILIVIGAVIAHQVMEELGKSVFRNSIRIRKILLGTHFIEGCWIERVNVLQSNANTIAFYALFHIRMDGDNYRVDGEIFDLDYNKLGAFHSQAAHYHNLKLSYFFEGKSFAEREVGVIGRGELNFSTRGGSIDVFTGEVVGTRPDRKLNLDGKKITEKEAKMLTNVEVAGMKKVFVKYFGLPANENRSREVNTINVLQNS